MDIQSIVIGAGVVGLAVARELARSGREVLVLERHTGIGQETSSRNSEVIHAGIYYPQHSLKAELCVRGKHLLYEFCDAYNVEYQRVGKLIVATSTAQLTALSAIYAKGAANGVHDLRFVERAELRDWEPELAAERAIFSPSTGIINSHELMVALLGDMQAHGGLISLQTAVHSVLAREGGFTVVIDDAERTAIQCRELINCAGLSAQQVSARVDGLNPSTIPQQYLSRGCYFTLAGRTPFRHLIYPIPNNEGLGVHLTLDLQGRARFGPDTQWVDSIDYSVDPKRADDFYDAIRGYYPALGEGQLEPAYAGIRPKITGPGETAGDFDIQGAERHGLSGFVALYGIESPGLTSSLAIAERVLKKLQSTS